MKNGQAQTIVISGRSFFVEKMRRYFGTGSMYSVRELLPNGQDKRVGLLDSMSEVRKYAVALSDSNPH